MIPVHPLKYRITDRQADSQGSRFSQKRIAGSLQHQHLFQLRLRHSNAFQRRQFS